MTPGLPEVHGVPRDGVGAQFPDALRAAIATRGVSLEYLRQYLSEQDLRVSVATLSYWRSGRRLPDRGPSMLVLAELEKVLELPAGFLTSKINPRRPGSRVASALPSHYETLLGPGPAFAPDTRYTEGVTNAAIEVLGLDWDDGLRRVSYHDRIEIRPDRTDGPHDVRTVFVADRDGVDRFPIWYTHDDPQAFPFVLPVSNCTLGRVAELREQVGVAAEMLLDWPLERGESYIVEHRLESIGQTRPTVNFFRRIGVGIREFVVEVRFPPEATPANAYCRRVIGEESFLVETPMVGSSLHLLEMDPTPGVYGMEWEWA